MIVCNNRSDYDLLLTQDLTGGQEIYHIKKIEKKFPSLDSRFIFSNSGFNLRPTDISASIGMNQFKRLNKFKNIRKKIELKL